MSTTLVPPMTTDAPFGPTTQRPVPSSMVRKTVGVIVCIVGNILISVALNIQKYVHRNLEGSSKDYCYSFLWWVGLTILGIGELGNFGAYGFAPASVVAPLGSVGVISNIFIAVLFMKEKVRFRDIVGVVWAVVGGYLIISFSTSKEELIDAQKILMLIDQYTLIVFLLLEVVLFIILVIVHLEEKRINPITMCLQVALIGSPTVITAKAVSSMISTSVWKASTQLLKEPIFWMMLLIMICSIIATIRFLNGTMKLYDSSVVMPIYFVFYTIIVITSGVVFYQELWNTEPLPVGMSLLGAALSFGGVYMISGGRQAREGREGGRSGEGEEGEGLLAEDDEGLGEGEEGFEEKKASGESDEYLDLEGGDN